MTGEPGLIRRGVRAGRDAGRTQMEQIERDMAERGLRRLGLLREGLARLETDLVAGVGEPLARQTLSAIESRVTIRAKILRGEGLNDAEIGNLRRYGVTFNAEQESALRRGGEALRQAERAAFARNIRITPETVVGEMVEASGQLVPGAEGAIRSYMGGVERLFPRGARAWDAIAGTAERWGSGVSRAAGGVWEAMTRTPGRRFAFMTTAAVGAAIVAAYLSVHWYENRAMDNLQRQNKQLETRLVAVQKQLEQENARASRAETELLRAREQASSLTRVEPWVTQILDAKSQDQRAQWNDQVIPRLRIAQDRLTGVQFRGLCTQIKDEATIPGALTAIDALISATPERRPSPALQVTLPANLTGFIRDALSPEGTLGSNVVIGTALTSRFENDAGRLQTFINDAIAQMLTRYNAEDQRLLSAAGITKAQNGSVNFTISASTGAGMVQLVRQALTR